MDIKMEAKKPDIGLDLPDNMQGADKKTKKSPVSKRARTVVTLIIIVVVLLLAGFLVNQYTSINLFSGVDYSNNLEYNKDAYHAVFLSNGQVYFGKITKRNDATTLLEDIYYLQVSNPLQQVPPPGTQQQPQLTLVKLGNELHGPKDYMKINNNQIIFAEELRNDGKVVQAILQYKVDNAAQTVK